MKTRAEISQFVLVEIKKNSADLVDPKPYRTGCWQVSSELTGAIAQIQKTTYEFSKNRFMERLKNQEGNYTGETIYCIHPKSYIVAGNLKQLSQNEDKLICFELYRRAINVPEIITYDELYERAKCIIETLQKTKE